MLDRFQNLPIVVKSLLAPGLLITAMVILAAIFEFGMAKQDASLTEFHDVSFARSSAMARLQTRVTTAQADTYRLLGWSSAGIDRSKVEKLEQNLRKDLAALEVDAADLDAGTISAEEAEAARATKNSLKEFISAANETLDVAIVVPISSLVMMTAQEEKYDRMQQDLNRLAGLTTRNTDNVYAEAREISNSVQSRYLLLLIIFLALGGCGVLVIARAIARPVVEMTGLMARLADDDTTLAIPHQTRHDEIGGMARAVEVFKRNALARRELERAKQEDMQRRDDRQRRLDALTAMFDEAVSVLVNSTADAARRMRDAAEGLHLNASSTLQQAASVSSATELASGNVNMIAATSNEMLASIREISHQAVRSVSIAGAAAADSSVVNDKVEALSLAAGRIGQIVTLITAIAQRTNMLALNATIEASRAGEAGRGFSVVAVEVKELANQTSKATGEISDQVGAIQTEIQEVVAAIRRITRVIDELHQMSNSIAGAVEEQGCAMQDVARSVEEAARGTTDVAGSITFVVEAAHSTSKMVGAVQDAAGMLEKESRDLKGSVESFLSNVKAA